MSCPWYEKLRPAWRQFSEKHEELDAKTGYFCVGTFAARNPDFAAADQETRHELLADRFDDYARVFESFRSKEALLLDQGGQGRPCVAGPWQLAQRRHPGLRVAGRLAEHLVQVPGNGLGLGPQQARTLSEPSTPLSL